MARVFLFFNHTLTRGQHEALHRELAISEVISPPEDLGLLWAVIPPDSPTLKDILVPVCSWLKNRAAPGDFILVQGDFGACYLLVQYAFQNGLIPIYSTTRRRAEERHLEDGSVRIEHTFKHVIFRRYNQ
jgi:hypothetical protein